MIGRFQMSQEQEQQHLELDSSFQGEFHTENQPFDLGLRPLTSAQLKAYRLAQIKRIICIYRDSLFALYWSYTRYQPVSPFLLGILRSRQFHKQAVRKFFLCEQICNGASW